jgi:hypothetical protein
MSEQPNITGPWTSDDDSQHRLELAITDQVAKSGNGSQGQPVLAMRDTAQPGQILYVTQGQLRQFMSSAQQPDSSTARVLAGAGSSGGSARR